MKPSRVLHISENLQTFLDSVSTLYVAGVTDLKGLFTLNVFYKTARFLFNIVFMVMSLKRTKWAVTHSVKNGPFFINTMLNKNGPFNKMG